MSTRGENTDYVTECIWSPQRLGDR